MLRIARRLFSQAQKSMLIQNLRLNWKKIMRRSQKMRAWKWSKSKIEHSINKVMFITLEILISIPVIYLANQPSISKDLQPHVPESLFQFRAPFPNPHPLREPFGEWRVSNGTTFYSFFLIGERSKPPVKTKKKRMERYLILL
jgi:hypothetical protein